MGVLNQLATVTAESDEVDKCAFVRRTLQALSVSRVIGNGWMLTHAFAGYGTEQRALLPSRPGAVHTWRGLRMNGVVTHLHSAVRDCSYHALGSCKNTHTYTQQEHTTFEMSDEFADICK